MTAAHMNLPMGRTRGGFTLVEVLVSAALIALGFVALVAAFGRDSVVTQRGEDVMMATFLADEVRDLAIQMTYTQAKAMNGATYTCGGGNWSEVVSTTEVSATDLNDTTPAPSDPKAVRLTVNVKSGGRSVLTQAYFIFDRTGIPFTGGSG